MKALRSKKAKIILGLSFLLLLGFLGFKFSKRINLNPNRPIAEVLDSLDGVYVYYNGGVGQSHGRNLTADGYNLGIQYQCVEFVKRYYWQHFRHKMPDSYGHAKDFYHPQIPDGSLNKQRGLLQFLNGSQAKPKIGDLLVWKASIWNQYGHVAIVSAVLENEIELVQQNAGPFGAARKRIPMYKEAGLWKLAASGLVAWLRLP